MNSRMRAIFSKTGNPRFISHLDLVRLFQRASRRASLPIALTQGFSPRLKISIARALKLGKESGAEEAIFFLERHVEPDVFVRSMNDKLPEGVTILKAEEIK